MMPVFYECPMSCKSQTWFNSLKEWLPTKKSIIGNDCGIEGIVFWVKDGKNSKPIGKIKCTDFR